MFNVYLAINLSKPFNIIRERYYFCRANKRKVKWIKEDNHVLPFVVLKKMKYN